MFRDMYLKTKSGEKGRVIDIMVDDDRMMVMLEFEGDTFFDGDVDWFTFEDLETCDHAETLEEETIEHIPTFSEFVNSNKENAYKLKAAILALANSPEHIDNFVSYLGQHFPAWLNRDTLFLEICKYANFLEICQYANMSQDKIKKKGRIKNERY